MKKYTLIILLFINYLFSSCFCLQAQNMSSKICGSYYYTAADSLSGVRLSVNKNGTFSYTAGGDIQSANSYGKWIMKKDTLVLNSSIDRNAIPITVEEIMVDSLSGRVILNLQNVLDGDIIGGIIRLNGDTTKECIPLFLTGCSHDVGTIKNFRVDFINGTYSRWYDLKNLKANLIKITSDVRDIEAMQIVNQKYLYRNGKLFPTPSVRVTELNKDGNLVKREIVLDKLK